MLFKSTLRLKQFYRKVIIGCMTLVLSACVDLDTPDLRALYALQSVNEKQPPVILIHGILGSRLEQTKNGIEYWPSRISRIAFGNYPKLALPIDETSLHPLPDPRFKVTGIAAGAAGRDFYGRIIDTLESVGRYVRAKPGEKPSQIAPNYYVFAYDWRQDNVTSARQLHAFIEQIRIDHENPELKVDVVAHSMGGLVTRYYARFGTTNVLDGNEFPMDAQQSSRIRRAILLGTPSLGSASAIQTLVRGYKVVLGTVPPEVVATFPSTYQLLPHALNSWLITNDGKPLERDQFDIDVWRQFQLSIFDPKVQKRIMRQAESEEAGHARIDLLTRYFEKHLERARRFTWSLTVPVNHEAVSYVLFGSDCFQTPARMVVEETDNGSALRLHPKEVKNKLVGVDYKRLMLEPGDGTVTKASLLARQSADLSVARHRYSNFSIAYPVFLCEKHSSLTGNANFQNNLLHALLSVDE